MEDKIQNKIPRTYKPKQVNVEKLLAYLSTQKND